MIELNNVIKTYTTRLGVITQALDSINLALPEVGMVFVLGKSGSGKSTLLNLLGGLDRADSGHILIDGEDLCIKSGKDLDAHRCHVVGFVFQDFNIIEHYSVRENIGIAMELQGKPIDQKHLERTLETVGLEGFEHRKGNEVSGGQKQRIAIARALIKQPRLILADEPTGNLDSETSDQIMHLLKEVSKETLVVVVSHDPEEAQQFGDRIITIKDGRIAKDEIIQETYEQHSKTKEIKGFLKLSSSFKYGIHALRPKRLQLVMTSMLLTFSLMISNLLGAYLHFLSNPEERLSNGFQTQAIIEDLQGYLTQANAEILIIGTYVLLLGIFYVFLSISVEQRIKQMGIFKAIGARHHDVLKIFVWEALLLGFSSFVLSSLMAYTYLLDINKKFYDGLQVLSLYHAQLIFHGALSLILPGLFVVVLTLNTLRKNSVISILKES